MIDYLHFCAEDFAQDDFFIRWVLRPDADTEAFWQNWLTTFAFRRNEVEAARQLVLTLHQLPQIRLSSSEKMALRQRIFDEVEAHAEPTPASRGGWQWAAAAVLLVGLLGAWLLWLLQRPLPTASYQTLVDQARQTAKLQEIRNAGATTRVVALPDGSCVLLRPHSRLSFPGRFTGATRPVYLEGAAFFEVAKNPGKPFFVNTAYLVTKVLGTSFEVQAPGAAPRVVVRVRTGCVSVYPQGGAQARAQRHTRRLEGFVLAPNQQAEYRLADHSLERTRLPLPTPTGTPRTCFEYEATPMREVFAQLTDAYGVPIVYDQAALGNCPLTASFTDEPLFEKLRLICKALDARYQVHDDHIVVTGAGCQ